MVGIMELAEFMQPSTANLGGSLLGGEQEAFSAPAMFPLIGDLFPPLRNRSEEDGLPV